MSNDMQAASNIGAVLLPLSLLGNRFFTSFVFNIIRIPARIVGNSRRVFAIPFRVGFFVIFLPFRIVGYVIYTPFRVVGSVLNVPKNIALIPYRTVSTVNHRGNYFTLARQSTIAKITHYVVGSSHTCFACLEFGLENRRFDTTSLEANSLASQKSSIETDRLSAVHKLLKCNYLHCELFQLNKLYS